MSFNAASGPRKRNVSDTGIDEPLFMVPQLQPRRDFVEIDDSKEKLHPNNPTPSLPSTSARFHPQSIKITLIMSFFLTLAAIATRYYKISNGNFVLWDEAHFGKFGSHYIKRDFYFDVHPPLGKMLVGLSGYLSGYNGTYEFNSGEIYPEWVDYVAMRSWLAAFGVGVVPIGYLTAVKMGLSPPAAMFVGMCLLFDNGLIGISRLILLDAMLIFFTVFATYCLVSFSKERDIGSWRWLKRMLSLGVSLGLVASVKWVGLFTIALAGLHTIRDLWNDFSDLSIPLIIPKNRRSVARHFSIRVICLIAAPIAIYIGSFYVHFTILNRSGPGDANMSSLFQAGLIGNDFYKNPLEIAYGSKVTFKSCSTGGGLLHSHVQTYPEGSRQQQVTTYHHKDSNNYWIIQYPLDTGLVAHSNDTEIVFIKSGDRVRLVHEATGRNLHSHPVKAPITLTEYEVSGYGDSTNNDPNDVWIVEIFDDFYYGNTERIKSLTTRFKLIHEHTGCILRSEGTNLPEWGFKQGEVVCDTKRRANPKNLWNIETHINPKMPEGTRGDYKSRFMDDLIDINVGMYTTNNALIPDPELEPGILTSSPLDWPMMRRGIRMSSWADNAVKFYMLGNPFVWWASTAAVAGLTMMCVTYIIMARRGALKWTRDEIDHFSFNCQVGLLGWALHYFPFFLMGRVTYFHHYFPASFFAVLCLAVVLDHVLRKTSRMIVWLAFIILSIAVAFVFVLYMPICYGITGPSRELSYLNLMSTWNLIEP